MNFKSPFILALFFVCSAMGRSFAAPANDHCSKAMWLKDVTNYCSSPRQFTNYESTPGGPDPANCFPGYTNDTDNDVWFKFTAVASVVNISVIGAIENNPGGTLQYPQFALYRGNCNALYEIGCISDGQGYNIVETFIGNLAVGETYYLRVDGRNYKTGTFQLCINNFNPVPSPSSDCTTAVVLCDKSSFTVPSMNNAGRNTAELPKGICVPEESQSAWYKWTCEESGLLSFTLKPINPSDDLDFVLFLLPNGVSDCSMKIPVRCMAAGENLGAPYSTWERCSGTTGLSPSSSDIVEDQGCDENNDNFLTPLRMESGKSYALMVNNYQNTGNGFSVEFGGSGTFVGPVAHFTVSKLKIATDQNLTIKNASTFAGGIENWEWNFGVGAKPQKANGAGPHTVTYNSGGKKSISLSIETSNGCKVTKIRDIQVTETPPPPVPKPKKKEPAPKVEPVVTATPKPTPKAEPEAPVSPPEAPSFTESTDDTDNEEAEPTTELTQSPEEEQEETVSVEEAGTVDSDTTMVVVTYDVKYIATIYFKADSFALEEKDFEMLQKVVEMMNENPKQIALVEGHTNNIPSNEYCEKLGKGRADSVIDYFTSKGIDSQRLTRKVLGKKHVVTKDISHPSRRRNQRVEVKLLLKQE
ncbi:MAG: OmpA family protein [Saprospiraceae bacterium]|nr:OmpA family protein [Saprospiraceae bacterium]MCF8250110.1 OmpA family protein [Saprospiraceae bacterium]MCF8279374.1 OmpA family protein [Bacteroidales bacterium]MCF8311164.1 OmpA family protein [Saprospiraceae bacterium]MCF8440455.1 OmpA family protein [Saprospiraceae bacterium]